VAEEHTPAEPERSLQQKILLAVGSRPDCRLFRQQAGHVPVLDSRDVKRAKQLGLRVRYMQLAPVGAADLTGITDDGRRIELEVKTPKGALSQDQRRWGEMIQKFGGVYGVVRSVDEANEVVDRGGQ
jgi:hypothetical protein